MINQPELQTNSDKGYLKARRIVVLLILCTFGITVGSIVFEIDIGWGLLLLAAPPALLLVLALLSSSAPLKELKFLFGFNCILIIVTILFIFLIDSRMGTSRGYALLAIPPVLLVGLVPLALFGSLIRKRSKNNSS